MLGMPQISWVRDELLLACALVVENGWQELRQTDQRVRELSDLLRALHVNARLTLDSARRTA